MDSLEECLEEMAGEFGWFNGFGEMERISWWSEREVIGVQGK